MGAVVTPLLVQDGESQESDEIETHHWIIFGVCLWASLYVVYFIFDGVVPLVIEAFQMVYYPIGMGCCLIFQQKLEKKYPAALASAICSFMEKDVVCALWLILLFFLIPIEIGDLPELPQNIIAEGLLFILSMAFVVLTGVSFVWIASRKTYLAIKHWRLTKDEKRRKSIALRAALFATIAFVDWARAGDNLTGRSNPLGGSVSVSVEVSLASATLVGAAMLIRKHRHTWSEASSKGISQVYENLREFHSAIQRGRQLQQQRDTTD